MKFHKMGVAILIAALGFASLSTAASSDPAARVRARREKPHRSGTASHLDAASNGLVSPNRAPSRRAEANQKLDALFAYMKNPKKTSAHVFLADFNGVASSIRASTPMSHMMTERSFLPQVLKSLALPNHHLIYMAPHSPAESERRLTDRIVTIFGITNPKHGAKQRVHTAVPENCPIGTSVAEFAEKDANAVAELRQGVQQIRETHGLGGLLLGSAWSTELSTGRFFRALDETIPLYGNPAATMHLMQKDNARVLLQDADIPVVGGSRVAVGSREQLREEVLNIVKHVRSRAGDLEQLEGLMAGLAFNAEQEIQLVLKLVNGIGGRDMVLLKVRNAKSEALLEQNVVEALDVRNPAFGAGFQQSMNPREREAAAVKWLEEILPANRAVVEPYCPHGPDDSVSGQFCVTRETARTEFAHHQEISAAGYFKGGDPIENPLTRKAVFDATHRVAEATANSDFIGIGGVDFLLPRIESFHEQAFRSASSDVAVAVRERRLPIALEINPRDTATSDKARVALQLTGGKFDAETYQYRTDRFSGGDREVSYKILESVTLPEIRGLTHSQIGDLLEPHLIDPKTGRGIIPYMTATAPEFGVLSLQVVGENANDAGNLATSITQQIAADANQIHR